jgi:hypothetical protein
VEQHKEEAEAWVAEVEHSQDWGALDGFLVGTVAKILIIEKTVAHHCVAGEPLAGTGVLERRRDLHRELLDQQVRHSTLCLPGSYCLFPDPDPDPNPGPAPDPESTSEPFQT